MPPQAKRAKDDYQKGDVVKIVEDTRKSPVRRHVLHGRYGHVSAADDASQIKVTVGSSRAAKMPAWHLEKIADAESIHGVPECLKELHIAKWFPGDII
jgi:ribosomal protein L21E